jgi:L-threonylcarbamoyladenylate synthase
VYRINTAMQLDFHINTEKYDVKAQTPDLEIIRRAAELIKSGGMIIYPTDTLYGLGVNANNPIAMERLYKLKGRDKKKPVSLLINTIKQAQYIVGALTNDEERIFKALLPGKITIIVAVKKPLAIPLMHHLQKIGFRIPESPLCHRLVLEAKCPITATSLNKSNEENITRLDQLDTLFYRHVDLVLDAGPVPSTKGSTVIDASTSPATLIREGDVSQTEIERRLGHKILTSYPQKYTVTFICSGNICRSPMAQGILRQIIARTKYRNIVAVNSAGTIRMEPTPVELNTLNVAQKHQIELHAHVSKPISIDIVHASNLIICMARDHFEYLTRKYPAKRDKIVLLKQWHVHKKLVNPSVADPIGQNIEIFKQVFGEIQSEIKRILPFILKEIKLFITQSNIKV